MYTLNCYYTVIDCQAGTLIDRSLPGILWESYAAAAAAAAAAPILGHCKLSETIALIHCCLYVGHTMSW